jgi:hypothetical protein
MRRIVILAVAVAGCSGCAFSTIPRSAILGQSARAIAPDAAEIALSAGLAYYDEGSAEQGQPRSGLVQLPNLDGNLTVGVSDLLSFNVHGGNAGIQPGLKVNLLRDDFSLAVQPQFGLGYAHEISKSSSATGSDTLTDIVLLTPGLRVFASHAPTGLNLGVGYTFEYGYSKGSKSTIGGDSYQEHQLVVSVGYEAKVGILRFRPELTFLVIPAKSSTAAGTLSSTTTAGDYSWALLPTLTVALEAGGK